MLSASNHDHLRDIDIHPSENQQEFPFNLPFVKNWCKLVFSYPVTFFAGENGGGKSTLMKAMAFAIGSITIGSDNAVSDPTLTDIQPFDNLMKLVWSNRTRRGFFLRAEDFFGYTKQQTITRMELLNDLQRVNEEYANHSSSLKD